MKSNYLRSLCVLQFAIFSFFCNHTISAQSHQLRMAAVGNSITFGTRLDNPGSESYPAQLQTMLSAVYGDSIKINNYGVSGRNMLKNGPQPIWDELAFENALEWVPEICLILLGTNDSKPELWDSLGGEFFMDYMNMIDTFRFRNPNTRFILGIPPPAFDGNPYGQNDSVLQNFVIPLIDSVAKLTGSILVDFHTALIDSMHLFPDLIHPDVDGAKLMAQMLFDTIKTNDLIHEVESGLAYVSTFEQVQNPVADGSPVNLRWTTIYADSVFLNGELVPDMGSAEVIADSGTIFTLIAKGSRNTSNFPLKINTYQPVPSAIKILVEDNNYRDGGSTLLHSVYTDQFKQDMSLPTDSVTWSVIRGEGYFHEPTDTTILFTPLSTNRIDLMAQEGTLTGTKTIYVNNLTPTYKLLPPQAVTVFPNPAKDDLFIKIENQSFRKLNLDIVSVLGERVFSKNLNNLINQTYQWTIDISEIPDGLYFYIIVADDQAKIGEFIKE